MRKTLCVVAALSCLSLTGLNAATGTPHQSYRKTLNLPEEIQGYPCAKGYAWFFVAGKLEHCTVGDLNGDPSLKFGEDQPSFPACLAGTTTTRGR